MDKYTRIPDDVLEALFARKLSPIHYQVMLYVARKTYGYGKTYGDSIAVTKMAEDIGRWREKVSRAVKDLEIMGMLEVERKAGRKYHVIQIRPVSDWDIIVTKTSHVSKSSHVTKTSRKPYRKRHDYRDENVTYNIQETINNNIRGEIVPNDEEDADKIWPAEEGWY